MRLNRRSRAGHRLKVSLNLVRLSALLAHFGCHLAFDNYRRSLTEHIIGSLNSAAKARNLWLPLPQDRLFRFFIFR